MSFIHEIHAKEMELPQDSFSSFMPVVNDARAFYQGIFELYAETDPKKASAKLFLTLTNRGFFFIKHMTQGYAIFAHKVPSKESIAMRPLVPRKSSFLKREPTTSESMRHSAMRSAHVVQPWW
ncbi:MAG: hypothetical protein K2X38_16515 [Gemmataceae bacterium]|nr:hypothetical protein [Gemmataceae bacterium]